MIELIVEDCTRGKKYDLSNVVQSIQLDTQLENYPAKLEVKWIEEQNTIFYEGARTTLKVDGIGVFLGYVFSRSRSENAEEASFIAYDQTRYLQNKETKVFEGKSVTDIFEEICKEQLIDYEVVTKSTYLLPERLEDNKSFYEMIQYACDITLIDTEWWFTFYDDFGICKIVEIGELGTDLIVGDGSLLTGFSYDANIDEDSFNQVKIVYEYSGGEPNAPKKRDVYLTRDSDNIASWGLLQYYETVQGNQNDAQLKARADMLLKAKNKVKKTLDIECIGDWQVRAGRSVYIDIQSLENEQVSNRYALVHACTHDVKHGIHTMKLSLEVL